MGRKVKLAIFDNDLKATVKKYALSKDGTKIIVVSGGEAHWAPSFDNDSYIEFKKPLWKGGGYDRIYFVKKKGAKCVNFITEPPTVTGPSEEQLKTAVGGLMLKDLGKGGQEIPTWVYIIIFLLLGVAAKVFGVIV